MPDIDIDFAVDGRDRVFNYVVEKYGRDRVAQIITFSTMAARAAVRDAGRVLEIPYGTVDKIAKLIPEGPGQTLTDCMKPGSDLRKAVDADPVAKEVVDLALPLEGLTRADSIHAAGVVIGAEPLMNIVPLQQKGADQEVVTQFKMGDVDALGLLKIDFLGLRNLDVIVKAVELIGGGLDIAKIPMDDKKTYEMLARGESTGVFQFESSGMREALRQVKPTQFEDLIALVALYRPGPMGYIPAYGNRKAGREQVTYIDPRLEADPRRHVRDLHLPGAVHANRARPRRLLDHRSGRSPQGDRQEDPLADGLAEGKFLEGCAPRRTSRPAVAKQLWEDIEKAAGLLLPEGARRVLRADRVPHRVAAREPSARVHGGAHLLGDEHEGPRAVLRQRVHEMGIEVLPPDVNYSQCDFAVVEGKIRFGLNAVKNVGDTAARAIVAAREKGGAVHVALGLHRARRPDGREQARARVADQVRCARLDRDDALGDARRARAGALLRAAPPGRPHDGPGLALRRHRREADPSADRRPTSTRRASCCASRRRRSASTSPSIRSPASATSCAARPTATSSDIERRRDGEVVTVGGIVSAVKQLTTKKGDAMVFLRLEDVTGGAECVVFNSTYANSRDLCVTDRILIVKGRIDHKEGESKLIALDVSAFEAIPERREVLPEDRRAPGARGRDPRARPDREGVPRRRAGADRDGDERGPEDAPLGPDYRVEPAPDFFAEVKALLGPAAVL